MYRLLVALGLLLAGAGLGCSRDAEDPGAQGHAHEGSEQFPPAARAAGPPHTAHLPEGYAAVDLGVERAQRFGVRSEPVRRAALSREVRTVGIVHTDETRESHVHMKWDGWIEDFFVSYVGQKVKRGDPLFSVYSPDLVTAQQELLVALTRAAAAKGSGRAGENETADALLSAARTKLRLFDVPEDSIATIEERGQVLRAITVRAPRHGTVIEKMALPGMYVEPSMDLYTIADLSRVWVLADLYEYETPFVQVGQAAIFAPIGVSGSSPDLPATVTFVAPTVDTETRTLKIRLELPNADGRLRPGVYGTVRLQVPPQEGLVIPADAVLDTGERRLVFVEVGPGRFEPRAVRLGTRAGDRVQVIEGLDEGEPVVTRAQFMLDSESRLRSAAASGGQPKHGGH